MFRNLFLNNSFKRVSSPWGVKNSLFGFKKSFSTNFKLNNPRSISLNQKFNKSNLLKTTPLLLGSSLSFLALQNFKSKPILNDSPTLANPINLDYQRKKSRFGGQLNYEELTIGSITGLFLGVIAGKLSSVLVILTLGGYFLLQFLESRNLITIPWNSIISLGKERVDIKKLVFEKPSFKLSFVLTFLIAAFNM